VNVVCSLLGNFPASEFDIFVYFIYILYKIQTPGNYPEESTEVFLNLFAKPSFIADGCEISADGKVL
jgi:hypothetical protein